MTSTKEDLVSSFLEITTTTCRDFASNILKDKRWDINSAIQSFFEGGYAHKESPALPLNSPSDFYPINEPTGWGSDSVEVDDSQEDNNFDYDINPTGIEADEGQEHFDFDSSTGPVGWGSEDDENEVDEFQEQDGFEHGHDSRTTSESNSLGWEEWSHETNLATSYNRPTRLVNYGSFYEAKAYASHHDRWLLMDVQSREQFTSNRLNRDTRSTDTIEEILSSRFVIWETDDGYTEGQKVCYFYKLISLPAILVIDPVTGEKMCAFRGFNQPEDLLEDLMRFTGRSPKQQHNAGLRRESAKALTHQTDEKASPLSEEEETKERSDVDTEKPIYPNLPEEPTEKKLICKVGICLPSGERVQRSFLKTDSTKLLWSFCSGLLEEEESRRFCFVVPRSPKLFYHQETSFEEAGLSSALLRLCFEEGD